MRVAVFLLGAMMIPGLFRPAGFAQARAGQGSAQLPLYTYTVVKTYSHDADAFTQGLQFVNGVLYEGTGLNGRSSIRKVELETGKVLQKRDIPEQYFGEGVTIWKSELIQLTWQTNVAFT